MISQRSQKRILVAEDDPQILQTLSSYLDDCGFEVIKAADGMSALSLFHQEKPDIVILDLMLPMLSGFEIARAIREESAAPIIMLTARTDEKDRVAGLELGADDYVIKPFSMRELLARIRSVLRRVEGKALPVIEYMGLTIDLNRRCAQLNGSQINLTATEFDVLATLGQNPNRVFTRLQLLQEIRGNAHVCFDRTIDAHIKNLRKKIEPIGSGMQFIVTVQGVGYKFSTPTR